MVAEARPVLSAGEASAALAIRRGATVRVLGVTPISDQTTALRLMAAPLNAALGPFGAKGPSGGTGPGPLLGLP